jgi:hypothetical protein
VTSKRELEIRTKKVGNYEIIYAGGGEVPAALSGTWNRKSIAEGAIDRYVAEQRRKDAERAAVEEAKEVAAKALAKANLAEIKEKAKAKKAKTKVESLDGEGKAGV